MTTGFLWDEKFLWWDQGDAAEFMPAGGWIEPGRKHAENSSMKLRLRNLVHVSGLIDHLVSMKPRMATLEEVTRFHTVEHVERMKDMSDNYGGDCGDGLTPFSAGGFEIAMLAAGGVIEAADAVWNRKVNNAYAMVRPSGHHAEPDRGRGNCMFGNAVLAIKHLQETYGVARVAVIDWDVHHGNGTQLAFYDDPSVLTISLHQDRYYPQDSGFLEEIGEGEGYGSNINLPLPPGTGPGGYLRSFEDVVLPAIRRYQPEFIVNIIGYDSCALEPVGRQMLTSETYREMTRLLVSVADEVADGRLLCTHEGGYSAAYVPFCGMAVIEELSGHRTEVEDPFLDFISGWGGMDLQPHQLEIITKAAANLRLIPEP